MSGCGEGLESGGAGLELSEVEAKILLGAGELGDRKEGDGAFGGVFVLPVGVVHGNALEGDLVGEEEGVGEGEFRVEAVAGDDVGKLEGEQRVEVVALRDAVGGGDGGGVDERFREDDGVADGERLERLREQGADFDGGGDGDLVVGEDVVGESLEGVVEVGRGVEQAGLEEAVDEVGFGGVDELALTAEGAYVGGVVRDVLGADDGDFGVDGVVGGAGERVAPDVRDGLEFEGAGGGFGVVLLDVEGGGEPECRAGRRCARNRSGSTRRSLFRRRRSRR